MASQLRSHPDLQDGLTALPGIGPKRAQAFAQKLGIHNIGELLRLLPRRYQPIPPQVALQDLAAWEGQWVRVCAKVASLSVAGWRRKAFLQLKLEQDSHQATALFFGQIYLQKSLDVGQELVLEGKVSTKRGLQLHSPRKVSAEEPKSGLRAFYPQAEGLSAAVVAKAVAAALPCLDFVQDPLPAEMLRLAKVPSLPAALATLHAPESEKQVQFARKRLALEEMLQMEIRRRRRWKGRRCAPMEVGDSVWQRVLARIPFSLNEDQQRVLALLRQDLAGTAPMQRLLHGEVGSGKTAVAFALALLVAAAGGQVALVAPTELLARQHLGVFRQWLHGSRLHVVGLLGDDTPAGRRKNRLALRAGHAHLVIGTHALMQEDVQFRHLRLVIFDEQHRFGVRQKAALLAKGEHPHALTMTATPIPRTLAWAQYGALNPCVLHQRVGGVAPLTTQVMALEDWQEEAQKLRAKLEGSERCFLVVPRIDGESGLEAWVQRFFKGPWQGIPHAVVHGRMPGAEVERAVEKFRRSKVAVLCGTTVVEVGIDVAGVEHMLVVEAGRLGLASLHQLRGRLARGQGSAAGHCRILVENAESLARLRVLESCTDGFAVAAADLQRRGAGTLVGTRQHGTGGFSAFDPLRDHDLIVHLQSQEFRNWMANQG